MKDALLVIDMQQGCFKTPRYDQETIIFKINNLIKLFRDKNKTIIFVQHDGSKENWLIPNTEDYRIIEGLGTDPNDIYVQKTANDAFYNTSLLETLNRLNIDTLYITGLATDFCVNSTVQSALVKDFNMTIISDCHTTADKPNFKAKDIIDFHNLIWDNLTDTNGKIEIIDYNKLISTV